jgi:hypothetical protein
MIPHGHPHGHERGRAKHSHPTERWRGLHKDWRTWAVIAVMLAAIGTYVLTLDESIQPGSGSRGGQPTAAAPGSPPK